MSFKNLQIRYQTARSLPAPYAYFYTLTAQPVAANFVQVDLAITYPDRDDIEDDELIAEGYTRDDDYAWSGKLPKAWFQTIVSLVDKTRFLPLNEDELGEDDDFWDIKIEVDGQGAKQGKPKNADDWQYSIQELIQATYEAAGRERPFELTYLTVNGQHGDTEIRLTASFADRSVKVLTIQNRREQAKTLPWSTLQHVMSEVYNNDYDTDEAQLKRPKQDGQWLNLGTEEWYDISGFPALTKLFRDL